MLVLSIITTLISSTALVGVAISLIIQARQLRASQLQTARSLHAELIKIAMGNPTVGTAVETDIDPSDAPKAGYLNLYLMFLQTSYSLKAISNSAVRIQAQRIFRSEYACTWWAIVRATFKVEATTRREREFVMLVDVEFEGARQRRDFPDTVET